MNKLLNKLTTIWPPNDQLMVVFLLWSTETSQNQSSKTHHFMAAPLLDSSLPKKPPAMICQKCCIHMEWVEWLFSHNLCLSKCSEASAKQTVSKTKQWQGKSIIIKEWEPLTHPLHSRTAIQARPSFTHQYTNKINEKRCWYPLGRSYKSSSNNDFETSILRKIRVKGCFTWTAHEATICKKWWTNTYTAHLRQLTVILHKR